MPPGSSFPPHFTDSIDYGIIVHGEATLHLDDGASTLLKTGDVLVQLGNVHGWENKSSEVPVREFLSPSRFLAPSLTLSLTLILGAGRHGRRCASQQANRGQREATAGAALVKIPRMRTNVPGVGPQRILAASFAALGAQAFASPLDQARARPSIVLRVGVRRSSFDA
jgi:hypothetical protein